MKEYFEPKENWKEYEYLGKQGTVIKELDETELPKLCNSNDYMDDYYLDKHIFKPKQTWAERIKGYKQTARPEFDNNLDP